ncbi:hypothetical protein [Nocardia nova]|uniref:hypothetical protein n=1 Tax=Nocardia nova TaxID=37330 RepID=UPI0033FC515D
MQGHIPIQYHLVAGSAGPERSALLPEHHHLLFLPNVDGQSQPTAEMPDELDPRTAEQDGRIVAPELVQIRSAPRRLVGGAGSRVCVAAAPARETFGQLDTLFARIDRMIDS